MTIALIATLAQVSTAPVAASQGAAPQTPPAAAPAKPAKPEKPKRICYDEVATGSIIANRVCRTSDQIEADRQQAKRDSDALSDHLAACRGAAC